jgi:hypothetical protein
MESAIDAEARRAASTWRMGMASGKTPVPERQARDKNWDIIGRSPRDEPFRRRLRLPSWKYRRWINIFPEADMPISESYPSSCLGSCKHSILDRGKAQLFWRSTITTRGSGSLERMSHIPRPWIVYVLVPDIFNM